MSLHHALRKSQRKTVMATKNSKLGGFGVEQMGSALADRRAQDHLFSVTYEVLRRLASTVRRGDPSATLNPTALVNEAWLKLANFPRFAATSRKARQSARRDFSALALARL